MKGSKKEKLKISKLTQDWTQEDWQKFSEWWNKQDFNDFNELVAVDIPEDRPLMEGDKIKAIHMERRAYNIIRVEDLKQRIKRRWIPNLLDENLTKEKAEKLNYLLFMLKGKFSGSSSEILTILLTGVLLLLNFLGKEKSKEYYTPIDLEDFLKSNFLQFLFGGAEKFKTCKSCGKAFVPVRSDQQYCSSTCRDREAQARVRAKKRSGERKEEKVSG